jgi:hypothetical protein
MNSIKFGPFQLGPDYCCMAFGFTLILAFSLGFLAITWDQLTLPMVAFSLTAIINCMLSYLCAAVSDPGLADPIDFGTGCELCGRRLGRGTVHCEKCGVCIEGYDHHCPWVGKCIGRKNLLKFYYFIFSIFMLFIVLSAVSISSDT